MNNLVRTNLKKDTAKFVGNILLERCNEACRVD